MMRHFGLLAAALWLCSCAVVPHSALERTPERICEQTFGELDRAVDAAGVRDGAAHRPDGFPYVRSTRFLASFANELTPAQTAVWTEHLRQVDLAARSAELRNLGSTDWPPAVLSELERCGALLMQRDLTAAETIEKLRAEVSVPDDYANWQRWLGVYPLAAPFMAMGIQGHREEVRADFAEDWQSDRDWSHWAVPAPGPSQALWNPDALGIPVLAEAQWQTLAQSWAPSFLIQDEGSFDQPVQPLPGGGSQPEPLLFWERGWTRFHGEILPQLTFTLWFSERPPSSLLDSFAGRLDGLMWRVTLDHDGSALAYETAHSCGCYHYVFPARHMRRVDVASAWQEQPLQPQGLVPWQEVTLVVRSGDHFLLRVVPRQQVQEAKPSRALELRDYDELRSVKTAQGFQSLFAENGLVTGTERLERFWLWPTGVPSPGTMRQSGRHATAFLGRAHFDDPFLLESLFAPSP